MTIEPQSSPSSPISPRPCRSIRATSDGRASAGWLRALWRAGRQGIGVLLRRHDAMQDQHDPRYDEDTEELERAPADARHDVEAFGGQPCADTMYDDDAIGHHADDAAPRARGPAQGPSRSPMRPAPSWSNGRGHARLLPVPAFPDDAPPVRLPDPPADLVEDEATVELDRTCSLYGSGLPYGCPCEHFYLAQVRRRLKEICRPAPRQRRRRAPCRLGRGRIRPVSIRHGRRASARHGAQFSRAAIASIGASGVRPYSIAAKRNHPPDPLSGAVAERYGGVIRARVAPGRRRRPEMEPRTRPPI